MLQASSPGLKRKLTGQQMAPVLWAGAADGACLVGGDIADGEFRAVAQLHHQDVPLLEAGVHQGVGEAVALPVQFPVGPAPVIGGGNHRGAVSVPPYVPHETFNPSIARFEYLSEVVHFSVFCC